MSLRLCGRGCFLPLPKNRDFFSPKDVRFRCDRESPERRFSLRMFCKGSTDPHCGNSLRYLIRGEKKLAAILVHSVGIRYYQINGSFGKETFQKSPFSRDSRDFRDSRDCREAPKFGKRGRIRPLSIDSRECRDFRASRDSSSEQSPFVMTSKALFPFPTQVRRWF